MTANDIEKVQIIATTKDEQHFMAISSNRTVIYCIVALCTFFRLKKDLFEQCSIKELMVENEE